MREQQFRDFWKSTDSFGFQMMLPLLIVVKNAAKASQGVTS
jgi:hypothetical protein